MKLRIAAALCLAAGALGCAHVDVGGGWGSSGASAQIHATGGAAVVLGVAAALADPYQPEPVPALDPQRKVNEQDCNRQIGRAHV